MHPTTAYSIVDLATPCDGTLAPEVPTRVAAGLTVITRPTRSRTGRFLPLLPLSTFELNPKEIALAIDPQQ